MKIVPLLEFTCAPVSI